MSRPVHFEIHASDPERAARFYMNVFGWSITKYDMPGMEYWGVVTGTDEIGSKYPGINGGLLRRRTEAPAIGAPVNGHVNTITVDNIDASVGKVKSEGGSIALEKMQMPGVGWLAYGIDTENNIFGMLEAEIPAVV